MEIGLFQLENLSLSPSRFLFYDLRPAGTDTAESLRPLLVKAIVKTTEEILTHILEQKVPKEFPIVLLCEDGARSSALVRSLEAAGHNNVYVVAGGVIGLLSEL